VSIFNFTENDLRENQHGLISLRQKDWLQMTRRHHRSFARREALIMVGFVFLILGFILIWVLQDESARTGLFSNPDIILVILAVLLVIITVLALAIFLDYRDVNRLKDINLSSVSGVVHLEKSSDEYNNPINYVIVGTKKFFFKDDMSQIFKEGNQYHVYYCESGKYRFIMSYELL
jgi:succinate dehydrogenase hydrophobic anchor subunit